MGALASPVNTESPVRESKRLLPAVSLSQLYHPADGTICL